MRDSDRLYPDRPIVGVGVVVFRADRVLLIQAREGAGVRPLEHPGRRAGNRRDGARGGAARGRGGDRAGGRDRRPGRRGRRDYPRRRRGAPDTTTPWSISPPAGSPARRARRATRRRSAGCPAARWPRRRCGTRQGGSSRARRRWSGGGLAVAEHGAGGRPGDRRIRAAWMIRRVLARSLLPHHVAGLDAAPAGATAASPPPSATCSSTSTAGSCPATGSIMAISTIRRRFPNG